MSPSTLVVFVLAVGVVAFVLAPLFRKDGGEAVAAVAGGELQDLRSRHDMALAALTDLEDDRDTGKIGDDDYDELKARLTSQAVEVMKELDAHDRAHPAIARRRRPAK